MGKACLFVLEFVQPVMPGGSWQQEAGHTASTVREQREMDAAAHLAVFFSVLIYLICVHLHMHVQVHGAYPCNGQRGTSGVTP